MSTARMHAEQTAVRGLEVMQAPGLMLYGITLVAQVLGVIARGLVTLIVLKIVAFVTGWPIPEQFLASLVAFGPLAVSLLAVLCPPLICPLAGRWWEMECGARPPEPDEIDAFNQAIERLQEADPTIEAPNHWCVAEVEGCNASVYANSLCLDRAVLENHEEAAAIIAHELHHLRSGDGRLTCALQLMSLCSLDPPPMWPLGSLLFNGLLWVASGQAVLWFFGNSWETYWRSREYAADDYTIRLGEGPYLASYLERHSLPYERPVRRMRFSMASHPYTKQRITRLQGTPMVATGAQS
jgi:Peptidase family M48